MFPFKRRRSGEWANARRTILQLPFSYAASDNTPLFYSQLSDACSRKCRLLSLRTPVLTLYNFQQNHYVNQLANRIQRFLLNVLSLAKFFHDSLKLPSQFLARISYRDEPTWDEYRWLLLDHKYGEPYESSVITKKIRVDPRITVGACRRMKQSNHAREQDVSSCNDYDD